MTTNKEKQMDTKQLETQMIATANRDEGGDPWRVHAKPESETKRYEMHHDQVREIERRFGNVQDMDDHYVVSVDGDGSKEEQDYILADLQQFLGSHWLCEWGGSSNTDADGCTTEDISVTRVAKCPA